MADERADLTVGYLVVMMVAKSEYLKADRKADRWV